MRSHSVIFIDNFPFDDHIGKKKIPETGIGRIKAHFTIHPYVLPKRIALAFVPPILGTKSRYVYIDFVGPCLAILTLAAILLYGEAYKLQTAAPSTPPCDLLLLYFIFFPMVTFFLANLGQAALSFAEIMALLGYGLYGHIFTLVMTLLLDHEENNKVFFINLIVFGGLSGLRIALVLLASIAHPALRFLVCSVTTIVHLMFVVFIHFAYMHSTFVYGSGTHSKE